MKAAEEISQLLDDHIVMTQAMSFSPYKGPFEKEIEEWEATLRLVQNNIMEWLAVQKQWMYLQFLNTN